jgi:hypothetical protein
VQPGKGRGWLKGEGLVGMRERGGQRTDEGGSEWRRLGGAAPGRVAGRGRAAGGAEPGRVWAAPATDGGRRSAPRRWRLWIALVRRRRRGGEDVPRVEAREVGVGDDAGGGAPVPRAVGAGGLPRRGWAATPAPSCEGPRPCTAAPVEGAAPGGRRSLPGAAAAQVGGGCWVRESRRRLQWEGRRKNPKPRLIPCRIVNWIY